MRSAYIVDGYNLIHQWPELSVLVSRGMEAARETLLRKLAGFARVHDAEVIVVFDGRHPVTGRERKFISSEQELRVMFTREGEEADERIKRMVMLRPEGLHATVVSSDGSVAEASRRFGAEVLSAMEFQDRFHRARDSSSSRGRPARSGSSGFTLADALDEETRRRLLGE